NMTIAEFAPSHLASVKQCCKNDDGSAVLVIVKHRNVKLCLQSFLYFKTKRCGDVLEVNTAKTRRQGFDRRHNFVCCVYIENNRNGIDIGEVLKQHRLTFHDRQGALWANVTQAQHGGTVT